MDADEYYAHLPTKSTDLTNNKICLAIKSESI